MRPLKDIIKELRENHGNKSEVARKLGISPQRLGQYEKGKMEPKGDFYEKWEVAFGEDIRAIQKGGAIETNVSHGTINLTQVEKRSDNKEKPLGADAGRIYQELYHKFLGEKSDYLVIHRDMLKDHRIIAIEQLQKEMADLEAKKAEFKAQSDKDSKMVDWLMEQNRMYAQQLLSSQSEAVQKTKEKTR